MSDMTENRQVPVPLHTLTYAATALEGSADNGDRYEESRRVIHSVALAIENSFPKRKV